MKSNCALIACALAMLSGCDGDKATSRKSRHCTNTAALFAELGGMLGKPTENESLQRTLVLSLNSIDIAGCGVSSDDRPLCFGALEKEAPCLADLSRKMAQAVGKHDDDKVTREWLAEYCGRSRRELERVKMKLQAADASEQERMAGNVVGMDLQTCFQTPAPRADILSCFNKQDYACLADLAAKTLASKPLR